MTTTKGLAEHGGKFYIEYEAHRDEVVRQRFRLDLRDKAIRNNETELASYRDGETILQRKLLVRNIMLIISIMIMTTLSFMLCAKG